MKKRDDIRILTERFFEGETSLEEEQLLLTLYGKGDVPQDLRSYQQLFLDLAAIAAEPKSEREPEAVAVVLPPHSRSLRRWLVAASVAVLLGIGGIFWLHTAQQDECVAYIYGRRTTEPAVVMGELEQSLTSMTEGSVTDNVESQLNEMFNVK